MSAGCSDANCESLFFSIDSRVAQWKRAGPITQRSVDRNHALLSIFEIVHRYASWSLSVVVITSALHAEGRQFEPGRDHSLLAKHFHVSSEACQDGRVV